MGPSPQGLEIGEKLLCKYEKNTICVVTLYLLMYVFVIEVSFYECCHPCFIPSVFVYRHAVLMIIFDNENH